MDRTLYRTEYVCELVHVVQGLTDTNIRLRYDSYDIRVSKQIGLWSKEVVLADGWMDVGILFENHG